MWAIAYFVFFLVNPFWRGWLITNRMFSKQGNLLKGIDKKTVRRYGFRRLQPLVFFPVAHFLQGNKMWTLDGNVCCIGAPPNRQIY